MSLVLFDVDMTLIDTNGAGRAALQLAMEEFYGLPEALDGISFAGRTDMFILQESLKRLGVSSAHLEDELPAIIDSYVRHLARVLPERRGSVLPGAKEVVDALAAKPGVLVGLATGNFRRSALCKLRFYGLDQHLTEGGFGDDHAERASIVASAAQRLLGGRSATSDGPVGVVVLGDTPHDVSAALANGYGAAAVATGFHSPEQLRDSGAHVVFGDLSDPAAVVPALLAACAATR